MLRASCCVMRARALPRSPVRMSLQEGDDDARHAQPEVLVEARVLRRDDRVSQRRRDVVVADDDAALGGELADRLAVARQERRDRVGPVVVERADLGDVARKRERARRSTCRGSAATTNRTTRPACPATRTTTRRPGRGVLVAVQPSNCSIAERN